MSRAEPLEKVTLNLFPGEFKQLQEHYPEVGASLVVRMLVRKHLKQIEGERVIPNVEIEL